MAKLNCWQVKKCGREPGGRKVDEFGVCPASLEVSLSGVNFGVNGGRACWAIAGTFCKGEIQGSFALKLRSCHKCEFYNQVRNEEGKLWKNAKVILEILDSVTEDDTDDADKEIPVAKYHIVR